MTVKLFGTFALVGGRQKLEMIFFFPKTGFFKKGLSPIFCPAVLGGGNLWGGILLQRDAVHPRIAMSGGKMKDAVWFLLRRDTVFSWDGNVGGLSGEWR